MERAQKGRREAPLAPLEESSKLHDRVVFPTREFTAPVRIHRYSFSQRDKSRKVKNEVSLPLREPTKEKVPTRDQNSRKQPSTADQPSSRTLAKIGTVVKGACCTCSAEPHCAICLVPETITI